jgi:P-type Ca2+ transporter type 2C
MEGTDGQGLAETTSRLSPTQRKRAPTITIDTSAVGLPNFGTLYAPRVPNSGCLILGDGESSSRSNSPSPLRHQRSFSENRPLLSIGSRPASPHNFLSPTPKTNDKLLDPQNLLAVPGTRSRSSSHGHPRSLSSYGGETLLLTPTASDYGGSRGESSKAASFQELGDNDPLKADPREEHNIYIEDNPFVFSPGQLSTMFNPNSLQAFLTFGGLQGLVKGLRTDSFSGLSLDETALNGVTVPASSAFPHKGKSSLAGHVHYTTSSSISRASSERYVDRKRVFGTNRLPEKKAKNLLQIMWTTFNDKVLIILTVVAAISLGLGLYQDFGQIGRYHGPKVRWVEGVTIMVAVAIVVVVGSLNDYQKEQQFIKLNKVVGNSACAQKDN